MTLSRSALERSSPSRRPRAARGRALQWCALLSVLLAACGGSKQAQAPAPPKKFPVPLFDGLWLGMERDQAARVHPIRPALTSSGKNRQLWVYASPGMYSTELTFESNHPAAKLERIDVHFAKNESASQQAVQELSGRLGKPDVPRRKAATNAYGDHLHDQYDTVWSDATQYVFLTERVPVEGRRGPSVYFVTVKKKELSATGPPTGYVPPPAPKDKDGKPIEEPVF